MRPRHVREGSQLPWGLVVRGSGGSGPLTFEVGVALAVVAMIVGAIYAHWTAMVPATMYLTPCTYVSNTMHMPNTGVIT